jgi:hypothetical protein
MQISSSLGESESGRESLEGKAIPDMAVELGALGFSSEQADVDFAGNVEVPISEASRKTRSSADFSGW